MRSGAYACRLSHLHVANWSVDVFSDKALDTCALLTTPVSFVLIANASATEAETMIPVVHVNVFSLEVAQTYDCGREESWDGNDGARLVHAFVRVLVPPSSLASFELRVVCDNLALVRLFRAFTSLPFLFLFLFCRNLCRKTPGFSVSICEHTAEIPENGFSPGVPLAFPLPLAPTAAVGGRYRRCSGDNGGSLLTLGAQARAVALGGQHIRSR